MRQGGVFPELQTERMLELQQKIDSIAKQFREGIEVAQLPAKEKIKAQRVLGLLQLKPEMAGIAWAAAELFNLYREYRRVLSPEETAEYFYRITGEEKVGNALKNLLTLQAIRRARVPERAARNPKPF